LGYFCIKKLPKVNNHPMHENSPNLIALIVSKLYSAFFDKERGKKVFIRKKCQRPAVEPGANPTTFEFTTAALQ
jgi:hypothetical protein